MGGWSKTDIVGTVMSWANVANENHAIKISVISGNGLLGQSIPRIRKICPGSSVKSVLSLIQPQYKPSGKRRNLGTQLDR